MMLDTQKGLSATHNMITKKTYKFFRCYRTRNYVMHNNSIHRKHRENRKSLATNKAPTLCATLADQRPAYFPSWIFLVACCFINEDELRRIGDEISDVVHECRAVLVISFKSLDRNELAREVKSPKCAQQ